MRGIHSPTPGELRAAERKRLEKMTGHHLTDTGVGMSDQYTCSCGWKSNGYWDGFEWCDEEYEKHLNDVSRGKKGSK